MRVLCALLGLEGTRCRRKILLAVGVSDIISRRSLRLIGDTQAVGTHIGDQTDCAELGDFHAFIELLCRFHRAARLKAHSAGCLLLERRGDERRRGLSAGDALFHRFDDEISALERLENLVRILAGCELRLFAVHLCEMCRKDLARGFRGQLCVDRPVFPRLECADLVFSVHNQTHRDRLHSACGKSAADFAPEERAELIADDAVENAARLLRIDKIKVDLVRMRHTCLHTGFGDLIELDAVVLFGIEPEQLRQMPRNRFTLAVRVRCEPDARAFLCARFQILDNILFALHFDIGRLKIVLDIHAELGFRQIAHMAHRSNDLKAGAEIFLYGFRLSRRLNDHKF